jgi:hypothetical protein
MRQEFSNDVPLSIDRFHFFFWFFCFFPIFHQFSIVFSIRSFTFQFSIFHQNLFFNVFCVFQCCFAFIWPITFIWYSAFIWPSFGILPDSVLFLFCFFVLSICLYSSFFRFLLHFIYKFLFTSFICF